MSFSSRCIHTWENLEDMAQAFKGTTLGITITIYLWMIPGEPEIVWEDGRSDFDSLYVLAWRHPGTTVHYSVTNSFHLGNRLKSVSIYLVI